MSNTTTDKNWRLAAAMSRPTGTFLTIPLSRCSANFGTRLRIMIAASCIRHLPHQSLVHQVTIYCLFKYAGRQFDRTNLFTGHVDNWNFHHALST
jgi:hypothetical protein